MDQEDDLRGSLERLIRLGRTPEVDIRPVLLRVLVDMFARRPHHTPGDLAQFDEMIGRLLDDSDAEVRRSVAEKLARHPATPRALLERFLAEGGPVAVPILGLAAVDDEALTSAATWGTTEMALAVAGRPDLSRAAVQSLIDRPEPEVLQAVAANAAAPIEPEAFRTLVRRARDAPDLGRALLARPGFALDQAPLFLLATSEQRAAIVLAARREDLGPDLRRPGPTPGEAAALTRVERAILSPDRDGFDAALAAALNLDLDDAWRLIDDPKGEPLALALAALGASAELAARVFILSGPAIGHSVMAVRTLTALVEALPRRTALRLVAAMTRGGARAFRRASGDTDTPSLRQRADDGRPLARPRDRAQEAVTEPRRSRG